MYITLVGFFLFYLQNWMECDQRVQRDTFLMGCENIESKIHIFGTDAFDLAMVTWLLYNDVSES